MYRNMDVYDDKPHEECGVFGIFDRELSAFYETYYGIFALQHRGQESAGITVSDGKHTPPPVLPFPSMCSLSRQTASPVPLPWLITATW